MRLSVVFVTACLGDVGYELLLTTAPEEFENKCVKASIPAGIRGDFIIPSVGQMEMGDSKFVGYGDSFGKLQRFEIQAGQVCATYRMMNTKFYNDSVKADKIAPGMLFWESDPPQTCPFWDPVCDLFGGNDNTFVNTMKLGKGDTLVSTTDSPTMIEFDQKSLKVIGKYPFAKKDIIPPFHAEVPIGASAHPLRHPSTGHVFGFESAAKITPGGNAPVRVYSINETAPTVRNLVQTVHMDTMPYMHSFGLTENYIVFPRQPVNFQGYAATLKGKAMHEAFPDIPLSEDGPSNGFWILPIAGGDPIVRYLPVDDRLYYTHTVNTYESGDAIVIDLTTMPINPFASEATTMPFALNKTARDTLPGVGLIKVERFHVPLNPELQISREILSNSAAVTDFPKVNPAYSGRKHCFFWAVQWRTDPAIYASMAVVRYDVCSGAAPLIWRRESWFPSEPTFIASAGESGEDAGHLVFTALDGEHDETHLVFLDARTMEEVSLVGPFPKVGFTTHGEFYESASQQGSSFEVSV